MRAYKLVAFIFISISVKAQEKQLDSILVNQLKEVVVTATRTEKQLEAIPLPVTVISKSQLKKTGALRLQDILNEQTGIVSVPDESGFVGVQLQGISSEYIMVLIDGVPVIGRNAGNLDLSRLAVGNVKKIEVVKGPSSALYGSEALGGVINIITDKKFIENFKGELDYRYGSFNTTDLNVNLKVKEKGVAFNFYGNYLTSDGYNLSSNQNSPTVNSYQNFTLNSQLTNYFSEKLKLNSSFRFFKEEQDVDGISEEEDYNTHLKLQHKPSVNLKFDYELYYTQYKAIQEYLIINTEESLFESSFNQSLLRPEVRGVYTINNNSTIMAGVGMNFENLNRNLFRNEVSFQSEYVFLQYDFFPLKKLNMIVGARFDNHSEYQSQLSPKLSATYALNNKISIKGSIGYGFKAPDFRQLYLDFTNSSAGYTVVGKEVEQEVIQQLENNNEITNITVNRATLGGKLNAESSVGINLGASYRNTKLSLDVNYFRNDFKNLIDTRVIARKTNGQNVFGYYNIDRVYTTGTEFNISYKILNKLTLSAGYQLLFAKDKKQKEAVANGNIFARHPETLQTIRLQSADYFGLPNRSRHIANFKAFYEISKYDTSINARLIYRSKYALADSNGNGIIDAYDTSFVKGYLLANVSAQKTFNNKYTLQVGIDNLFDYTDRQNIPTLPGIQFFTKVNVQF